MIAQTDTNGALGVVVIGRNEGDRLKRCIESAPAGVPLVYVDSQSTDGSAQWARVHDADVVELDLRQPFTAARARNTGFNRLCGPAHNIGYVQFVDGDCELIGGWTEDAVQFLEAHADVGAVTGQLRERYPERSIYNWLCEREWNGPAGEARAFGGIVMIRATALKTAGGFRDDLIAGEEPELGVRMRAAGWRLWRLERDMAIHDAAMTRFSQWWRRAVRAGYADALGARLHGRPPERHRVWESRRAWLWGVALPLLCLAAGLILGGWAWALWLIFPLQVLRQMARNSGSLRQRATIALFQMLARFAEAIGQMRFLRDRLQGRRAQLIEYK